MIRCEGCDAPAVYVVNDQDSAEPVVGLCADCALDAAKARAIADRLAERAELVATLARTARSVRTKVRGR